MKAGMRIKSCGNSLSHGSDCRSREEDHSGEANMGNGRHNIDQRKLGRAWLEQLLASDKDGVVSRTGLVSGCSQAMHGLNLDAAEHATEKGSCGKQAVLYHSQGKKGGSCSL